MRPFHWVLLLVLILGCTPSPHFPDLSAAPGGPKPVFLLDELDTIQPVNLFGTLPENAAIHIDTVKIGDVMARAMASFPTGAFSWNGTIPPEARLTCLLGVGEAPADLFDAVGSLLPVNRYGSLESPPPDALMFKMLVNGEIRAEWEMPTEDFDHWTMVAIDLSQLANRSVELTFAVEGVLSGTVLPYWAHPMIVAPRENPRRVILLGIDTVAAGHVGWMGYELNTTPNLDRFARTSTVFLDAHSPSPWTLPAFASVLSGRPPGITGANRNNRGLSLHEDMLAEIFRRGGFATAGFVNIPHLQEAGFFQGVDHQWEVHDHFAPHALVQARHWIDFHKDQDIFVFIHLFDPHIPYRPPSKWADMFRDPEYEGDYAKLWDLDGALVTRNHTDPSVWASFSEEDQRQCVALYDAEIAGMDDSIGIFFEWYEREGLMDGTSLIVFSDHGEEFGEHGRWEHGHSQFEEQLHVPFFIHLPGQTQSREVKGLVGTIDIYPTLLELFGLWSETEPFGRSLVPVLNGGNPDPDYTVTSESTLWGPEIKSVMNNRFKYVLTVPTGEEALYDLVEDPEELINVAESTPEQVAELGGMMEKYVNDTESGWHVRFLAGPDEPLSFDLQVRSSGAIENPALVTQILNGSGPGLVVEDSFTCRVTLDLAVDDTVELRFSTTPENAEVTFSGTIDGRPARRALRLGACNLPIDELAAILAGDRQINQPTSDELTIDIEDPIVAFSFPQYKREKSRGAYLWSVPESLRAHEPALTPEQEAALESVGYLFH